MKLEKQRELEFRKALESFLEANFASYQITDDGKPYRMHSGIVIISLEGIYAANGECVAEYTEFNL